MIPWAVKTMHILDITQALQSWAARNRYAQPDAEDVLWCRPDRRGERPRAGREERRKLEDSGGRNGTKKSSGPTP